MKDLKEVSAYPYSLQHYSQQPRGESNPHIHEYTDGWRKCGIHTMKYYSALKSKEICSQTTTCINIEDIMLSKIS